MLAIYSIKSKYNVYKNAWVNLKFMFVIVILNWQVKL